MDWLTHNFIADMYGPHFLVFYACVIGVTTMICWWRMRLLDPTTPSNPPPVPVEPDSYELAYLRGGEREVARVVILSLIQRGYVWVMRRRASRGGSGVKQMENHPDPRHLSKLEATVFHALWKERKAHEVFGSGGIASGISPLCWPYEERLRQEQLLAPLAAKEAAWKIWFAGAFAIFALGG